MRLKCPFCEFEWECDNTPEKQEENNTISTNHLELHRPFPISPPAGWIDITPALLPVEVSEPPMVSEVIV